MRKPISGPVSRRFRAARGAAAAAKKIDRMSRELHRLSNHIRHL
jgi:hypothetical protein